MVRKAKDESTPRRFSVCAFVGCGYDAPHRVKNAALCYDHYIAHHNEEARKWNEAHGIFNADQARNYCKAMAKKMRLPIGFPREREPGSDDE